MISSLISRSSLLLLAALGATAAPQDIEPRPVRTRLTLFHTESEDPNVRGGGSIVGNMIRNTEIMDATTRQSAAILSVEFEAHLVPPATAGGRWTVKLAGIQTDLELGADLGTEAQAQAAIDEETVRKRLAHWPRELKPHEVQCLLTVGAVGLTVDSPFRGLGILRGGPAIADVYWTSVDISGDWEIVGEKGSVLTIAQDGGRIRASWKRLSPDALTTARPAPPPGLDLPMAPPRFDPNAQPVREHRRVGGPALDGSLAIRRLEARLWLAMTEETGTVDLQLAPQGDLLEGAVRTLRSEPGDALSPWESRPFALRRVRPDRPEREVRFVVRSRFGYHVEVAEIPYGEPFFVELTYRDPESRSPGTVDLSWGAGRSTNLPVDAVQGEPGVYRSQPLFAEPARAGDDR